MEKPVLVIMAAGLGSRYGGLKQIDPVDQDRHIIIDFSLFDSKRAGFDTVVFELPSYNIIDRDGQYSEEEIALFKTVVERGAPYFYEWAREGGIKIA